MNTERPSRRATSRREPANDPVASFCRNLDNLLHDWEALAATARPPVATRQLAYNAFVALTNCAAAVAKLRREAE